MRAIAKLVDDFERLLEDHRDNCNACGLEGDCEALAGWVKSFHAHLRAIAKDTLGFLDGMQDADDWVYEAQRRAKNLAGIGLPCGKWFDSEHDCCTYECKRHSGHPGEHVDGDVRWRGDP